MRTIEDIKAANAAAGGTWFSSDNMRFFGTVVVSGVYAGGYFVTGEFEGFSQRGRRRYTVRKAVDGGAGIDTIGEYQQYARKKDAIAEARRLAKGAT